MRHSYASSSYDGYSCLKPPLLLWVAMLYLSRGFTLPMAMGIGSYAGVDARAIALCRNLWSAYALLPSAVAAVVLLAAILRVPGASQGVRWIWARGRMLLVVALGLDFAQLLVPLVAHGEFDDQVFLSLLAAAADVYLLLYILKARRVRDAFAEFPFSESV